MFIRKRVKYEGDTCEGCHYKNENCYAITKKTPCSILDSLGRVQLFNFVKRKEKK